MRRACPRARACANRIRLRPALVRPIAGTPAARARQRGCRCGTATPRRAADRSDAGEAGSRDDAGECAIRSSGRLLCFAENRRNRVGDCRPARRFALELLSSRPGQAVVLRVAVVFGEAPLRVNPPLHFEPVQRRIKGAFLDTQHVLRYLLDPPGDREPMIGRGREDAQNQQWQRALDKLTGTGFSHRCLMGEPTPRRRLCQTSRGAAGADRRPAFGSILSARNKGGCMRASYVPSRAAIVISAVCVADASAHHSFAPHFDAGKPVSIEGTVTEYESRNPHSYLHIAAVDENGRTREYICESHGVTQLTRNGIRPDMFKAGTRVRVTGSLSRHSPYMCFFNTVAFADGRTLSVNGPTGGTRPVAATAAARKDIFGTWLLAPMPNRSTSGPQPMMQFLTPAGQKAVAAYDPFRDDPTFRCDPVGVRRVWGAPATPLEIVREGKDIVLRHEWMDVRRVVHMNLTEHPKTGPRSSLGHSIGRFDGDTLVIDTANFAP